MKAKTIKSVLRRKIQHWCDHIEDEEIKKIVKENAIVTGGSIASMLLGEKVNDYDVYFRTAEATAAVALYYINQFKKNPPTKFTHGKQCIPIYLADKYGQEISNWKGCDEDRLKIVIKSAGVANEEGSEDYQYFEMNPDESLAEEFVEQATKVAEKKEDTSKPPYRPVFLTANAITLSDDIQIVIRFFGEPDTIHENYDFVHCMNYWQSWDGYLKLRQESLECLLSKELRYVGSKYPLCSLFRIRKFIQRGWTINAGQILKACMQISKLDLEDVNVLEDQLTGVDAAYFAEVIRLVQDKMKETKADRIDSAYLVQIIDRLF